MRRLIAIASLTAILVTLLPSEIASFVVEDEKMEIEKDKTETEKDDSDDLNLKFPGGYFAIAQSNAVSFTRDCDCTQSSLFFDEVPTPPPLLAKRPFS